MDSADSSLQVVEEGNFDLGDQGVFLLTIFWPQFMWTAPLHTIDTDGFSDEELSIGFYAGQSGLYRETGK